MHFPGTEIAASVSFLRASLSRTHPLTSIRNDDRTAKIGIHEILNRSDTPREVIEFILGHELLHMVIRPRQIDGRVVNHPPEFWDAEVSLFPTRTLVWAWLYEALWSCLKVDKMREVTMVRRGWHNKVSNPFPTLKHIRAGVEADAKIMRYL